MNVSIYLSNFDQFCWHSSCP